MLNLSVIEGIPYVNPPKPPNREIRNYGLPVKNQKWTRHTEYEEFDWSDGWQERVTLPENADQLKYIEEELIRLYDGEWIYIKGEPIYLNNYAYFFLQWMLLENEYYPQFRDANLYYFRFIELIEKDKMCWGHVLIKGRRLGASSMEASIMLLQGLINRNTRQGIISKTGADAQDIFDFVVIAFQALPAFLKPDIEGTDAPKKELSIKKQASKITKDKTQASAREGLNNKILWKATALNSFDSGKLKRVLVDEAGKFLEVDVNTYIKIVGKTLTTGARVSGKLAVISTVNQGDKGGDRFKILWNQSDHLGEVNKLGQTASKLKRIFIAAYYGFEGYIDEYGYSVVENPTPEQTEYLKTVEGCPDPTIGAKQYLEMQRDLLKHDEEGLQEEIRQAPFTWQEVFETAGKKIYFNRSEHEARLEELKEDIKDLGRDPEKGENGRRGWFRENPDGTVRFVDDDKDGLWYIHKFPEQPNKFERSEILGVPKYKPRNTAWGAAGLDPFAHADATVEKGSDGCVIIRSRFSILDPDNTGMPAAMFLGRMSSKNKFHEQVFYGLKYFGVRMLGERAPSDWVDWAKENGYTDYLLSTKRSDRTEVFGAMPQNKEYLEEHLTEMVEASYNDVTKIPFKRLIQDRLGYDMKDRTDYDACIADGNALIALKEPLSKQKKSNKGVKFLSKGTVMTPLQY